MRRVPLPFPRRQRRSTGLLNNRALLIAALGGGAAAVAARGPLARLLGRGRSEEPSYAEDTKVDTTEGPALSTAQTEVEDIANAGPRPSGDDGAEDEGVPERIEDGPVEVDPDPLVAEQTEAARAEAQTVGDQPEDPPAA